MASNARVEAAKTEPSIFKEPMHFRDVNEKKADEPEIKAPYHMNQKAYEPEIMAIGPYHRGKENLQMMEEHKVRYLDSLLQRRNQNVEIYNSAVRELEQQARNCYTEPISLNSAEFVKMLVLDGCFIIELILRYADAPSNTSAFKDDPIFQTTFDMNRLQRDLILLDNQIPFSILSKLFDLISHGNLIEHILTFFRDLYPRAGYKDKTNEISKEQVKHLLDLIHKMWIPSSDYNVDTREANQTEKGFESNRTEMGFEFNQAEEGFESIRPATELHKANVRFDRKECDNLFEIEFRDGKMLLPHLTISDRTECFFRNLIAYEQYIPIYQRTRVTDYVWLMHCLINSGRDVEILDECGIIDNFLGRHQVVADMFNQLTDSVTDPTDNFVYAETFRLINTHYREHRARAVLKRDYFYRLWAYIPDTIHRARAVFNAHTPHYSILGQSASRWRGMESSLSDKWEVKAKHSSSEALQRWRDFCGVVKNPKRRFRFTANLSKRHEAAAMRKTIQENLRITVLVSKCAPEFIKGVQPSDYTVPKEVQAAGFQICADELGSIVEGRDVKKLKFHGGVSGIVDKLNTNASNGLLTDSEALNRRQQIYGINKFQEKEARSFWVFVWEALQDMTLMILGVCALVSLVVGIATEGWPKGAHDGLGIVASILLVVFVTAISDYRQSLQFRDLDKEKKKISIRVTRNGCRQKISIYDLLPGDIVHLAIGDQVPADGLFLSGFSVLIDESSLKGESEPVVVNAEIPFLLSGTKVQDGTCKMLVTTVGMRTQWGKLMPTLSEGGDDETPLQVKLNGVATIIGKIGLVFAIVIFAVLAQKLIGRKWQAGTTLSWSGDDALELLEFFAIAVTIVVVAVPEGLPLAVTLSLAFAMKKMMNDKALVRHLAACETMGSATSICSDKTGTLTTNHMTVVKSCICMNVKELSKPGTASVLRSELPESVVKILHQSIFNNTGGEVVVNKDGKREILGTPTETAILEFGMSLGGDFQAERQASKLVKVEPFNSTKKRMGVVLELPEGGLRAHTKGASEIILAACEKVINSNGEVVPLDEVSFNHLKETIEQFASEALRTLCLAYMELENGFAADDVIPASGYTCIGIVGIKDPIRPGVRESVALCRSAGVTVRMVTGDNINTAKAIARKCGILTDDGIAIEGPDFRDKSLEELHELIPRIQVMAHSSPLDKHTLVKHLRTTFNEVVAVTGDGTNDAPALHEADIGLAMGIAGTEVAKESADIIILDDNFSTIVTVAKWGRSVYVNIQKFVQFQLTVNIVALIVNFTSACLTGSAPLTAVQLLWVNMIMDTLGALALATEPPNDELMKKSPVGRSGNFISAIMWRNILGQSLYQFLVIWFLQAYGKIFFGLYGCSNSDLVLNTIIFNTFVFCQLFNEVNSREMEKIDVLKGILDNRVFVSVLGSTLLFQIIIIECLGTFANTTPLTLMQWLVCIFIGFLGMPIAVLLKKYLPLQS